MHRALIWTIATLVIAGGIGCSDTGLHNQPQPEYPEIDVDPLLVEYGALEAGADLTQEITIMSVGEVMLTVTDLDLQAPDNFELLADETSFELEVDDSLVERKWTPLRDVEGPNVKTTTDPIHGMSHGMSPSPCAEIGIELLIEPSEELVLPLRRCGWRREKCHPRTPERAGSTPLPIPIEVFEPRLECPLLEQGLHESDLVPVLPTEHVERKGDMGQGVHVIVKPLRRIAPRLRVLK